MAPRGVRRRVFMMQLLLGTKGLEQRPNADELSTSLLPNRIRSEYELLSLDVHGGVDVVGKRLRSRDDSD
jgi:hypothetical protein